jgi:hypothetical protein
LDASSGLEPTTTENTGENAVPNEDSNQQTLLAPLLGTRSSKTRKTQRNRREDDPLSVFGAVICYGKLVEHQTTNRGKPSHRRPGFATVKLRDLPRGIFRRGHKLYYRITVPVDAQRLLNRLEIWRSLRTDSLAVAVRRLPSIAARILRVSHRAVE